MLWPLPSRVPEGLVSNGDSTQKCNYFWQNIWIIPAILFKRLQISDVTNRWHSFILCWCTPWNADLECVGSFFLHRMLRWSPSSRFRWRTVPSTTVGRNGIRGTKGVYGILSHQDTNVARAQVHRAKNRNCGKGHWGIESNCTAPKVGAIADDAVCSLHRVHVSTVRENT